MGDGSELSSRFPEEGGLYVWSKEAFGDFHGFVAGWNYWIYTVFYFPGLLLASVSMSDYVLGGKGVDLSENRVYLDIGFFFFFNDTATTEIYTLSLHDALPI